MSKTDDKPSLFERLATFIVDKRNLIFFLYICALIFCLFSRNWVSVCDDIKEYLPETTETRQGLQIMEDELVTFGSAQIMVSHVTRDMAEDLAEKIENIEGVSSAALGDSMDTEAAADDDENKTETPEEIAEYFKGSNALISVTFDGEETDESSVVAMESVKELLSPYDFYIKSTVGNSEADNLDAEMGIIQVIVAVIIVLVLLFTSRSYTEIPVLLLTFVSAAVLNLGTNYWFGEISFVSNSVTVVLQLALGIDYSIILLHRFLEEQEQCPDDRSACITALSVAIPSISASSLTTISGLAAMMFMKFGIGFDMGRVLIKAILFSMLAVFTLMPGLLMLFSRAMQKTKHRNFVPKINVWGKLVLKLRYIGVPVFFVSLIAGYFLSSKCPYVYGYSQLTTSRRNETQIAESKVEETFGDQNIMALLVPKGDYNKEKALLDRLETYEEVEFAKGLANIEAKAGYTLTEPLTPRQFSEMTDIDYEVVCLLYSAYAAENEDYGRIIGGIKDFSVPLMDMFCFVHDQMDEGYIHLDEEEEADINDLYKQLSDGKAQMLGENYSRMIISLNLPEEGEETFAFLKTIHKEAEQYYDENDIYLVGDSTSDYDLSVSFVKDNIMISVLSVVLVIVVLLFTFQSVGLPILLISVIQGSIWLNFSFPGIVGKPIFFMSYLIITAIQMGANIDYAIVISTWYSELKTSMSKQEAIVSALNLSFPTILTSGTIMTAAGFLIGKISTEPAIVGIGECLCRGTVISIFLVMFILPQLLLLGDAFVERTCFNIKIPKMAHSASGTIYVNGRVRGRISGVVDANIQGTIFGDVSAVVETGNYQVEEEPNDEKHD